MPYDLTWEPRGVYRRYFGRVTIAERHESFERICADPRFDDLRYTITESLGVESYEVSDEATEEAAALHVGPLCTNPNIVMAAVAVDERIVAAIRHFMALQYTRQPYRVFATVAEARAWIEATLAQGGGQEPPPRLLR
jgi:hypothetical protein